MRPSDEGPQRARAVASGILGGLVFVAVLAGILFGCAGRLDLPMFWAYLGTKRAARQTHP